jgi:FkbM family methyltransferase
MIRLELRKYIQFMLSVFNLRLIRESNYQELILSEVISAHHKRLSCFDDSNISPKLLRFLRRNIQFSKAQLLQDLLAVYFSDKKQGYFVEFGATDGIEFSNTYLLEKKFGWTGILAEPAQIWMKELKKNRSVHLSFECVFTESGLTLDFQESSTHTLSSLSQFSGQDLHAVQRQKGKLYKVRTITLLDLLNQFGAPKFIDFLSIDTEGSEFEIIEKFDFSSYEFGFICIEHNHTENEFKIDQLLLRFGYVRILKNLSDFDGWYLSANKYVQFFEE